MADNPDRPPSTIPPAEYDTIRLGGKLAWIAVADALKSIIDAFNSYIARKGL